MAHFLAVTVRHLRLFQAPKSLIIRSLVLTIYARQGKSACKSSPALWHTILTIMNWQAIMRHDITMQARAIILTTRSVMFRKKFSARVCSSWLSCSAISGNVCRKGKVGLDGGKFERGRELDGWLLIGDWVLF
jgi:hypothetical protein